MEDFNHKKLKARIVETIQNGEKNEVQLLQKLFPEIADEALNPPENEFKAGDLFVRLNQDGTTVMSLVMLVKLPPDHEKYSREKYKILNLITGTYWEYEIEADRGDYISDYRLAKFTKNRKMFWLGTFSHTNDLVYLHKYSSASLVMADIKSNECKVHFINDEK